MENKSGGGAGGGQGPAGSGYLGAALGLGESAGADAASVKGLFAQVLVDIALENSVFTYSVPPSMKAEAGVRVQVPFGNRLTEGFILSISNEPDADLPIEKIKPIASVSDDFAAVKPEALAIIPLISDKFKLRQIDVLRLFLPPALRGRKRKRKAVNAEIRAAAVEKKSVVLSPEQLYIVNRIAGEANLNPQTNTAGGAGEVTSPANSSTFLIHGVTGSGKTEVYMNVIERCLARGFTAIMLVPEIGLTPQMLANFRARFGNVVAMLHSGLSVGERFDEWFRLFSGEAKIAIGARSAVFAPLENLGVIIIDEEHDGSYSAESNPRFNTHDVAEIRARYWHCPVVLGSATPGITSFYRAQKGEYELLKLEKRVNGIEMPRVEIVDMAAEMRAGNAGVFSRVFIERLKAVIEKKQQAIIFLNRRGFFASVMCKNCGWVARCQHCDVSLVFHKADRQLKCHYCSSRFSPVTKCPNCGSTYLKWGAVGTQAVVEEIEKLFPQTPIFRMDGDNVKGRETLIDILDEFGKTRPSILVGTQMVAKGHDFPHVALVGIIDADNSLHFSDFRAIERTFALVSQVAGRSGRAHDVGQVVLQTFIPTHYVYKLAAAGDYKSFYEKEINTRAVTKYPPFSTIVRVLVTAARDDKIKEFLEAIMATLRKRQNEFIYLGAMKSPLGRLDDKFRYQVLCRFDVAREREILDFIDSAVKGHKTQAVQVFMEINPQSLS